MKNFFKNLFKSRKSDEYFEEDENTGLKNQISSAYEKCIKERDDEINKIDDIKKWSKDLILEIFDVPTAYWYDELNEYENIKYHENNISISKRIIEKTDKVIEEYREQMKLSESKVEFCNTLINEYNDILKRLDTTIKKINSISKEEKQFKLLKRHKKRLADLRSDTGNFEEIFEKTSKLEILNDDIEKIEEDFNIKLEVSKYIENLDKEFAEDIDNINSLPIRKEIDKITKQIKNQ